MIRPRYRIALIVFISLIICAVTIFWISRFNFSSGKLDITYTGRFDHSYSVHGTGGVICNENATLYFISEKDSITSFGVTLPIPIETDKKYVFDDMETDKFGLQFDINHQGVTYSWFSFQLVSGEILFSNLPSSASNKGRVTGAFEVFYPDLEANGKFSFYVDLSDQGEYGLFSCVKDYGVRVNEMLTWI